MPSINDIVQVAEALEKSPVVVMMDRCVAVRNRNASCRRCVAACPKGAIAVSPSGVSLDTSSCVGCGACLPACPTEALVAASPTEGEVRQAAFESIEANDGIAVVACARIASKRQADPARYAEVPCLSRFDEVLACELAGRGAKGVLLVDGNCATCKHRDCVAALDEALRQAEGLISIHGGSLEADRVTGFPDRMRLESAEGLYGSTRRGFFSDAVGAAKETAKTAAKAKLELELGYKFDERSIAERLRVAEDGRMPLLRAPRHEAAINALYSIGVPESGEIESRLFGSVSIDVSRCNSCGMCVVFCPTGALSRESAKKGPRRIEQFEFSAADCVQCGLCVDVCWKGALEMSTSVEASELYDFEPRVFR